MSKLKDFFINKVIDFIALVIALAALIITIQTAYGDADLAVRYTVEDRANFYLYYNDTMLLEFIVQNRGYGSTVYLVEPIWDCKESNCTIEIKYNDRDFKQIIRPDLKPLASKNSDLVMMRINGIEGSKMPKTLQVLIRDTVSNKHIYKDFLKAHESTKIIFKALYE